MQIEASDRGTAHGPRRFATVVGAWLMLVAVGLASCTPQRPSRDEWRESWEGVQEVVPPAEQLSRPPDHDTCSEVLGDLRERGVELTPAPDRIIQEAAQAWLSHAESLFFGCFEDEDPEERIEEGYATLERLRAEVEAVLATSDE